MDELLSRVGRALLLMADTMDIWRDAAIMGLAALAIACLYIWAEALS